MLWCHACCLRAWSRGQASCLHDLGVTQGAVVATESAMVADLSRKRSKCALFYYNLGRGMFSMLISFFKLVQPAARTCIQQGTHMSILASIASYTHTHTHHTAYTFFSRTHVYDPFITHKAAPSGACTPGVARHRRHVHHVAFELALFDILKKNPWS